MDIVPNASTILPIASICTASLSRDAESAPSWQKTSGLILENPQAVINELLEMLEDVEPEGGSEFTSQAPNGIKAYVQSHAISGELKLIGEKFDPGQKKLRVFATCVSRLDKAISKYLESQSFMQDLYKNEPETGISRMTYISTNKQKMPHWTNPTDEAFLVAVWDLNRVMNDVRSNLETIGKTTPPKQYPQTIASIVANLHIVQMMDLETDMRH